MTRLFAVASPLRPYASAPLHPCTPAPLHPCTPAPLRAVPTQHNSLPHDGFGLIFA
ncbi:protein of unknown function [Candidatus Promineifilum breve]|uniref:Uncharacterized protein n=1 Tax=Candidatus Promineifilum breve TaxID=1806508 RepID=A0A160TAB1_9CHLR|nr:protein of unknown function [Candidatus Promineifilum breve]